MKYKIRNNILYGNKEKLLKFYTIDSNIFVTIIFNKKQYEYKIINFFQNLEEFKLWLLTSLELLSFTDLLKVNFNKSNSSIQRLN